MSGLYVQLPLWFALPHQVCNRIPLNDGRELAQKYQVEQHVRPLLDFDPTTQAVLPKPPSERALLEPSLNVLSGSGSTTPSGDMSPTAFRKIFCSKMLYDTF